MFNPEIGASDGLRTQSFDVPVGMKRNRNAVEPFELNPKKPRRVETNEKVKVT